jgi:hypothetical protein
LSFHNHNLPHPIPSSPKQKQSPVLSQQQLNPTVVEGSVMLKQSPVLSRQQFYPAVMEGSVMPKPSNPLFSEYLIPKSNTAEPNNAMISNTAAMQY